MKYLISALLLTALSSTAIANHSSSESMSARIAPAGELKIMTEEEFEAMQEEADDDVAAVDESGDAVYNKNCAACHTSGVAGAPKVGDVAGWVERIGQGMEILVQHAVQGYQGSAGVMPAKGGNPALSDAAVAAAVEHMVNQSQ